MRLVTFELNDFCVIFGLKVNMAKSKVMTSSCVPRSKCEKFSAIC